MAEVHDLAAPYALDALDPEEAARFEAHLDNCARCRAELADLGESAADLAAAHAVAPPPHVKEAVMNAVDAESAGSGVVVNMRPRRSGLAWTLTAAAAVIAVVFFGLWSVTSGQLDEANQIAAVYEAPDTVVVNVDTPNGPARFVYSPSLGQGVFNGASLSEVGEEELYELWLIDGETVEPAGTLQAGDSSVLVEGVTSGATLAMTVELAPGVDAPTSDPLFAAEL